MAKITKRSTRYFERENKRKEEQKIEMQKQHEENLNRTKPFEDAVKQLENDVRETFRLNHYNKVSFDKCIEKVHEGTATLKDLTNIHEELINFNDCKNKIRLIQLIYNAGSQVGACTVVAGNMYSVKLNEKSAKVFKNSLTMLKANEDGEHVPYESIWVEGYNQFTYKFKNGKHYKYYVVTNQDMLELERRISLMDYNSVTLEELQTLQNDLPPFVRAWQESSIDCSKDKSKVFVRAFSDFFSKIEVISTFMKNNMEDIESNLNEMKRIHRAGRVDDLHFKINLPEITEDVMPDLLGDACFAIHEAAESYMNADLLEMYKRSDRLYYEQFADECLPYPELALYIQQIFSLCTQAYQEDVKIQKEQYNMMRNAIYTKAAAYGVTEENVVKVAVSVAMRYVKERKIKGEIIIDLGQANVDNYKPAKVSTIFPFEYEVLRTNVPVINELNIIYMEHGRNILDGEEVEFVNGVSVDDTIELDELFTGIAYNNSGKLVYDVDVYEYEPLTALMTIDTFAENATVENKETDLGEFMEQFLEENNTVILTGKKRGNVLIADDKKTLVAKIVPSTELMPNGKPTIHTIDSIISFIPAEGRARVYFIALQ